MCSVPFAIVLVGIESQSSRFELRINEIVIAIVIVENR